MTPSLPVLRQGEACAGAGGLGAGHAVQRGHRSVGNLPALRARDQLPAAEPAVVGAVWPGQPKCGLVTWCVLHSDPPLCASPRAARERFQRHDPGQTLNGSCGPRSPTARSPAGSAPLGALIRSQVCAPSSALPHAAASAPIRLSSKPCAGRPPPTRVEQIRSPEAFAAIVHPGAASADSKSMQVGAPLSSGMIST